MTPSEKQFPDVLDARTFAAAKSIASGARGVVGGSGTSLLPVCQGIGRGLPVDSMVSETSGVCNSSSRSSRYHRVLAYILL